MMSDGGRTPSLTEQHGDVAGTIEKGKPILLFTGKNDGSCNAGRPRQYYIRKMVLDGYVCRHNPNSSIEKQIPSMLDGSSS